MADPKKALQEWQSKYGTGAVQTNTQSSSAAAPTTKAKQALAEWQNKYAVPQTLKSYNAAQQRSGMSRDDYDSSVRQSYAARAAASESSKVSESEFNRSTAMQQKYGSYANYKAGATADGKYYSQPEGIGADMDKLYNTYSTYEAALKPKAEALESANNEMQRLQGELETQGGKLEQLYSYAQQDSTGIAGALFEQAKKEYADTATKYETAAADADSAWAAYQPAYDKYVEATNAFESYRTEQQEAFDIWKSRIRGESDVQTDIDAAQAQIDTLTAQQKALEKQAQQLMGKVSSRSVGTQQMMELSQQAADLRTQASALQSQIDELQTGKELLGEELDWSKYYSFADLAGAADFKDNSGYVSTANGQERSALDIMLDNYSDSLSGYDDPLYEYINGNKEAGAYITNQAGALYGAGDNALGALFGMATESKSESQQMTEDEVAIFNYIYKTQGKDAAHAYYEYLTSDLNYRQRKEEEEYWADYAKESPVGSSVFSVLTAPMKGLSYIGQAADYLGTGTIDQNAAYNRFSYANNAIRNEVSKTIEESGSWGKVGSFAYNTGMSMADFLLNTAITGGFSGGGAISEAAALAIMGTGAAADATIDAKDRGLTDTQSFWLGTIAGAAEIATEKLSIDALLKGKWEDGAIKYILKNTFTEGSEEVGSDVINGIADVLIAKDKSEWQTSIDAYMAEGMTQQEAFNKAFLQQLGQMGLDFLGGAISGGVMSGTGAGIGTLQKNATYQKTGATIRKFGDETLQAIIDTGMQADVNTEAHKLAEEIQQKLQSGKTVSDAEIGKLFAAAGKAVDTVQTTDTEDNAIDLPMAEQAEQAQAAKPQTATAQPQQTANVQQPGMLPTAEQAEKQQRMNKATTELERSAIEFDVDEDTLGRVQRIAQIVGRDVVFYSAADNSNGYYDSKSGTLHINAQSQNPVAQIISHELTHSIEQTGDYNAFQKLILNRIQQTGGNIDQLRKSKAELYARNGHALNGNTEIDQEIVAEYVEKNLLTDEASIRAVVQQDRTLGRRILSWLNEMLAKMGNSSAQERAFLQQARSYYSSALKESQSSFTQDTAAGTQEATQTAEDIMQKTMDMMEFSYGGANANGADLDALRKAQKMQLQGVAEDIIFRETGWYEGVDGKWRFEIDDSGMEYSRAGELNREDKTEYLRYRELENKFIVGTLSDEEGAELRKLIDDGHGSRRADETGYKLSDFIKHDELFKRYPQLRNTTLRFEAMEEGTRGQYNPDFDIITLSESLRKAPEDTLVHEIQHAIQKAENFAQGSSPEYWERMTNGLRDEVRSAQENLDLWLRDAGIADFIKKSVQDVAAGKKTMEQHWADLAEFKKNSPYAKQIAACEREVSEAQNRLSMMTGSRTAFGMYQDTAGEIEARDAASRRTMTAEQRRQTMPNTGDENTVFAEDVDEDLQAIGRTADNKPFVTVEEDILDGVPEADWVNTVKQNLKTKFPNGVTVGNNEIKINQQSLREMTFSGYMKWLFKSDPQLRAGKLRATNNMDEVLQATTGWVDEGLNHPRKDSIIDFARGNVLLRVGGNDYAADVVVGTRKNGMMLMYDILNLQPTTITEKETDATKAKNPSPGTDSSAASVSTDSIRGENENVNGLPVKRQFSLSEPVEQTETLLALHNMDEEKLRRTLNLGAWPSPSIAIVEAAQGHSNYGEFSAVFPRSVIDPEADSRNKVYGSDAWTPTWRNAQVEYEVDYDTKKAIENSIRDLSAQVAGGIFSRSSVISSRVDDTSNMDTDALAEKLAGDDTVRAAYLAETGGTLEPVMKSKEWDDFGNEALQQFIDEVGVQELARIETEIEMDNANASVEQYTRLIQNIIREDYRKSHQSFLNKKPESIEKRLDSFIENRASSYFRIKDFIEHAWKMYEDGGATTGDIDRYATQDALRAAVNDEDVAAWVRGKMDGLMGEPGIYNGKERYKSSGDSRSFSSLHWPFNAENIVRAMNLAEDRGEGYWGASAEGMMAMATPQYGSVDEMHADEARLYTESEEDRKTRFAAIDQQIQDIIGRVRAETKAHASSSYEENDIIGGVLMQAATGDKNASGIQKAFKREGYDISKETAKAAADMYEAAAEIPTGYFEAKPQRVVDFDEALAVVSPDSAPAELLAAMRNAGMNVVEYQAGDEQSRLDIINGLEGAKFSISEDVDGTDDAGYDNILNRDARVAWGDEGKTYTEANDAVPFTYAIIPAELLTTSNDGTGSINPAYPAELQPRDRTRQSSQMQIRTIARNLNAEKLGESATAQNGAPIVRGDGVVIGGNGRGQGILQAYENGTADGYREYLEKNARKYGITRELLPDNPVLVRVVESSRNWPELARSLNESSTQAYSATEQAMADAQRMGDILEMLQVDEDTGSLNTKANEGFIGAFISRVAAESERNGLISANGMLSQNGLERVQNAVFAKAYGSAELSARLSESLDNDMKNVTNALMATAARAVQLREGIKNGELFDLNIVDDITKGVELYASVKAGGKTIAQWQEQMQMFDDYSTEAQRIAAFLEKHKGSSKKIRETLNDIYAEIEELGDPRQGTLFEGGNRNATKQDIIDRAAERYRERYGKDSGIRNGTEELAGGNRYRYEDAERVESRDGQNGAGRERPEENVHHVQSAGARNRAEQKEVGGAGDAAGAVSAAEEVRRAKTEKLRKTTTDDFLDGLVEELRAASDEATREQPKPENKRTTREDVERMRQRDLDDYWETVRQAADVLEPRTDPSEKISVSTARKDMSPKEKAQEAYSYFKRKMIDSGEAIQRIGKAVKDKSLYHFYNMARASTNAATSFIADERTDIYGRKTGKSLNDVFEGVRAKGEDYYKKFQLYLFHMHNVDRMSKFSQSNVDAAQAAFEEFRMTNPELTKFADYQLEQMARDENSAYYFEAEEYIQLRDALRKAENTRNKPVFGFDVSADDSKTIADTLARENKDFAAQAKEVYDYIDNLLRYRVDSGLITEEDYQQLKSIYPHYVPTFRVFERESTDTKRKNTVQIGSTIKKASGGSEKLMPLHKALAQQTMSVVREGSKNRFGQRLLNSGAQKAKGAAEHVLDVQEYRSDFSENTFDQPEDETFKKKNTFIVRDGGKLWEITVSPALYEAVQALSPDSPENNIFTRVVRKGNNLFKELVTGYNPTFLLRNFARDLQDAGLYSKDLSEFAKNYPQAVSEIAKNGRYWRQYKALGGTFSTVFDYDTGGINKGSKLKQQTLGRMETLNMAVEQAPRLAEFMATVKKAERAHGGVATMEDLMEAMYNAADITVNFGRSGTLGKVLNANYVPFLNPGIQGFSKMIRNVTETKDAKNWARLAVKAAALGILPTLLNALLYRDDDEWDDIKDRDKDVYYLFKIGDGLWLKIPKGRTLSLLGMTADRVADLAKGKTVDWAAYIDTALSQSAPANPFENNIMQAWFDTKLFDPDNPGETWYGTDIENQRLQNYAPGERYDASTDLLSKWIGETLGLSPKKINYLIDQYTGVVGDVLLPLLTPTAERDMLTAAFTIDSVYSNKLSNEFYEKLDELTYTKNGEDATGADVAIYRYWNKQTSAISDINAAIREIEADDTLSDGDKKELSRAQYAVRNELERAALESFDAYAEAAQRHYDASGAEDEGDRIDEAYRGANREIQGAEYALSVYNKDIYAKAQVLEKDGVSYDTFYDFYFGTKGMKDAEKYGELTGAGYTESDKKLLAGYIMGTDMETASGKPSQYAKMLDALETGIDMDDYLSLREADCVDKYLKVEGAGVSSETAMRMAMELSKLEPENGEDSTSSLQKQRTAIDASTTAEEQLAAVSAVSTESEYKKYQTAYSFGVEPDAYASAKEELPQFDQPNKNGNYGTYTQDEIETALDSFGMANGIVLPMAGRKAVSLTNAQKAVLWQLLTGSSSAKNNPYSTSIGQQVLDTMSQANERTDNTGGIMLPETSASGGIVLPMY